MYIQGTSGLTTEQLQEAFLRAAEHGVTETVRELHQLCGDDILHSRDPDLYTPLHRASYNGHVEVVEYLLQAGADVQSQTVDCWQPLHCACRWNKVAVADILLQNGAHVNAQSNGRQTPLHLAASNERARSTLLLLLSHRDLDPGLLNSQGDRAEDVAGRCGTHTHLFEMAEERVDFRRFLPPDTPS